MIHRCVARTRQLREGSVLEVLAETCFRKVNSIFPYHSCIFLFVRGLTTKTLTFDVSYCGPYLFLETAVWDLFTPFVSSALEGLSPFNTTAY